MYINKPNSTYETVAKLETYNSNIFTIQKTLLKCLSIQNIYRHIFLL